MPSPDRLRVIPRLVAHYTYGPVGASRACRARAVGGATALDRGAGGAADRGRDVSGAVGGRPACGRWSLGGMRLLGRRAPGASRSRSSSRTASALTPVPHVGLARTLGRGPPRSCCHSVTGSVLGQRDAADHQAMTPGPAAASGPGPPSAPIHRRVRASGDRSARRSRAGGSRRIASWSEPVTGSPKRRSRRQTPASSATGSSTRGDAQPAGSGVTATTRQHRILERVARPAPARRGARARFKARRAAALANATPRQRFAAELPPVTGYTPGTLSPARA